VPSFSILLMLPSRNIAVRHCRVD